MRAIAYQQSFSSVSYQKTWSLIVGKSSQACSLHRQHLLLSHHRTLVSMSYTEQQTPQPESSAHQISWSKLSGDTSTDGPTSDSVEGLLQRLHFLASREQLPPCRSKELQCEIASAKEQSHALRALREVEKSFFPRHDTESSDGTGQISDGDIETVPKSITLPTPEEYPDAPRDLFKPETVSNGIHNLCQIKKLPLEAETTYAPKIFGWFCFLKLKILNVFEGIFNGYGPSKAVARRAAWLQAASSMHTSGTLKSLTALQSQDQAVINPEMHDLLYWQKHLILPTAESYPEAPQDLFEASRIECAISGRCRSLQIHMKDNIDFTVRSTPSTPTVHVCKVTLDLAGLFSYTGEGEGLTKKAAKHAAWLNIVGQMHMKGTLSELFTPRHTALANLRVSEEEDDAEIELHDIDEDILKDEKNMKIEIYNFCAGLGLIPRFEHSLIQLRGRRARIKSLKPVVRVCISLPEVEIRAVGKGRNLQIAEAIAMLEFKRVMEEKHLSDENFRSQGDQSPFRFLTVDTAQMFLDFLRQEKELIQVEVEHETIQESGITLNTARMKVDNEKLHSAVTMQSKKQATILVHLTAAIQLAKVKPDLLIRFGQRLREGNGRFVKAALPVDLLIGDQTIHIMRKALIEARRAGLPDSVEVLAAVKSDTGTFVRRKGTQMVPYESARLDERLLARFQMLEEDPSLQDLRLKKAALPIYRYRSEILDLISQHPYSIIVGATGSGKTTQVPQMILENFIKRGRGSSCNVICTQPRRLAATSVSDRVATERNEKLQQSVGYQVRFDAKLPQHGGSITYCTTGILLERLKHDPDEVLDNCSHILIDEVHERDLNIDFLMVVIKKLLTARYASGKDVPKVVLMSATLDTDLFANYFALREADGSSYLCPVISVPGRTFPVHEKYLAEIMNELWTYGKSSLESVLRRDKMSLKYVKRENLFRESMVRSPNGDFDSIIDWKRGIPYSTKADENRNELLETEEAIVPTSLLAATIAHICKTTADGAILAFLPGLDEILQTKQQLREGHIFGIDFSEESKFQILLLHSTIPRVEQDRIFRPVPPGCRKIILSTNIAETSITVPDVKHVIDTGKMREKLYDPLKRLSKLPCVWISRTNSKQRAGRAGRISDGNYYALFSKERHDSLKAVGPPEILRTDLQKTCLGAKGHSADEPIEEFLAQAIEPPSPHAVRAAVSTLKSIDALTMDECQTDLGRLLSKLPILPALGKMIVLGVIFRCLSPMLVIGAAAAERPLFISPIEDSDRRAATASRRMYAKGELSDHLAMLNAFNEIRTLQHQCGHLVAEKRAQADWIHMGAFRSINQTAEQIMGILSQCGLLPDTLEVQTTFSCHYGPVELNQNSDNPALIKCLLLSGLHPNLAARKSRKSRASQTATADNVLIHPRSLVDDSKRTEKYEPGTLFAYSLLTSSNDGRAFFMRDITVVNPFIAMLFGGTLRMTEQNTLVIDEWIPVTIQAEDKKFAAKLLLEFRKALDRMLNSAFRSLANLGGHERTKCLADDPVKDIIVARIVEALNFITKKSNRDLPLVQESIS